MHAHRVTLWPKCAFLTEDQEGFRFLPETLPSEQLIHTHSLEAVSNANFSFFFLWHHCATRTTANVRTAGSERAAIGQLVNWSIADEMKNRWQRKKTAKSK